MKEEFPPLLPPGLHTLTLDRLQRLCVSRFEDGARRAAIFAGVERLYATLAGGGAVGDLWLDGSFLTEKRNPDDCDTAFRVERSALDRYSDEQKLILIWLTGNRDEIKRDFLCVTYPFIDYHIGDRYYGDSDLHLRSYWAGWFGCSRRGELKGIAVLRL